MTAAHIAFIWTPNYFSCLPSHMPELSQAVLTISEINRLARLAIEKHLPSCWIRGELSNMTRASSGHWYFTIKDASASARCVMFRARNQFVEWSPREGEQIEIRAQASLYEPRGDFQLIVEAMRRAGQGNLYEAFLRLKEKLQLEGLFEADRKQGIPAFPNAIGVITSPNAAALRDVLITLERRWPLATIIIYPCPVQGDGAPAKIQQAILEASERAETDVLLLVRGGGSLEDLWAFNDEEVARTIASSPIPIICGVGHETDFTIADFVADLRAPTPTAAAQLATPSGSDILDSVAGLRQRLTRHLASQLQTAWQLHDHLHRRLRHPQERLRHQLLEQHHLTQRLVRSGLRSMQYTRTRLSHLQRNLLGAKPATHPRHENLVQLQHRLHQCMQHQKALRSQRLCSLQSQLELLCPGQVIKRGFSIVRSIEGEVIVSTDQVTSGQLLTIELAKGQLGVEIMDKKD